MLDVALSSRVGAEFVGLACLFRAAVQGEDRHVASGEMGIPCAGCQGFASDNVSVPAPKSRRNPGATRARDSFGERPSNSPNAGPGKPARAAARLGATTHYPRPIRCPPGGALARAPCRARPFRSDANLDHYLSGEPTSQPPPVPPAPHRRRRRDRGARSRTASSARGALVDLVRDHNRTAFL